jgi:hypothetical protein
MATVTGVLSDYGFAAIPLSLQPRMVFVGTGIGFSGGRAFATSPVIAIPDSGGRFSVDLAPTTVRPVRTYTVRAEWLSGTDYVGADIFEGLKVPPQGGNLADLAAIDFSPTDVWVSSSPPANPGLGTWWLDLKTNNLNRWE